MTDKTKKEFIEEIRLLQKRIAELESPNTDQKKAEKAVKESEARLRTVLNAVEEGIAFSDEQGHFYVYNPGMEKLTGYTMEEANSYTDFSRLIYPDSKEWSIAISGVAELIAKGARRNTESKIVTKSSQIKYVLMSSYLVDYKGRRMFLTFYRDITERKRAEEEREKVLHWQQGINALQQPLLAPCLLEDKLRAITDSIVRVFDADFCRIWLIGPGDLCEQSCIHAEPKEGSHICRYRNRCLHLMASSGRYARTDDKAYRRVPFGCYKIGRIALGEDHKFLTNDMQNDPRIHSHEWARELGLMSFVEYQLRVPGEEALGVLAIFAKHPILFDEDVILDGLSNAVTFVIKQAVAEKNLREAYSELQETQDQLIQTEKLNTVGLLASGVAHEVQNPLATITQALNYLEEKISPEQKNVFEIVQMIKTNIKRASKIIHVLVDFSKPVKLQLIAEDINSALESSLILVHHEIEMTNIEIIKKLKEGLPKILVDSGKMEQVFVNIFLNSIQAMPQGGKIFIRTYVTEFNKPGNGVGKRNGDSFKLGETAVVVEIEDIGAGIPEENIKRMFDPFFTTKGPREGSGLGLAVTKNIISMHGGLIEVKSEVGKGTKVIVTLKVPERG